MADVIPLQQPAPAALARYRSLLVPPIDAYSQLVPLDALAALEHEIEASLEPAHPRQISIAVAALGAWLQIPPSIEDPERFGKAMEEELAGYPADILNEAVLQARRTLDWYPSIRAMIGICEQLIKPRREESCAIWQMRAEHHRRQQEAAERKAQAEREAQRAAAKIKWLQGLEERARERFGNDAPLPGDIELADNISNSRHTPWLAALDRGEPWAAKFCRLMALAERTRRAIEQRRIAWDECLAIGKLISRDEAAARSAVEEAEARDARPQYARQPPESFWSALWRIRKACGLEVPRSEGPDAVPAAVENLKHLTALAAPDLANAREILNRQSREEWNRRPGRLVSLGPAQPAKEEP
jgi:hypothetical protein